MSSIIFSFYCLNCSNCLYISCRVLLPAMPAGLIRLISTALRSQADFRPNEKMLLAMLRRLPDDQLRFQPDMPDHIFLMPRCRADHDLGPEPRQLADGR